VGPHQQQKVPVYLLHHQKALFHHHQLQKFLKMNLVIMIQEMLRQWKMLMDKMEKPQDNYGTDPAVNHVKVCPYL
jgi:hypothetical protein